MNGRTKATMMAGAAAALACLTLAGGPDSLLFAAALPGVLAFRAQQEAEAEEDGHAEAVRRRKQQELRNRSEAEAFRQQLDREALMRRYGGINV